MPLETNKANSPTAWMESARSDLAVAKIPLPPGGMYEQLCFHAQQSVEKSIKAVLLALQIEFPFTHNLQILFDLLSLHIEVPGHLQNASDLTEYAVTMQYPGDLEPVSESNYHYALELAEPVFRWAEETVEKLISIPKETPSTS
jgi:HEPN domain-containing protein